MASVTCAQLVRWLGTGAVAALLACRPEASPEREVPPTSRPADPVAAPQSNPDPAPAASAQHAPAGRGSVPGAGRFAFDFEDAGLPELVRLVGGITGKRFILTGKLPVVHATVRSPEPVTADEAYQAFLAILQANGLTVVQRGELWKILPSPGVPPEPGAGR